MNRENRFAGRGVLLRCGGELLPGALRGMHRAQDNALPDGPLRAMD